MSYTNSKLRAFERTVLDFYKKHGRRHLPWRKTVDPYRILVSEVMLQQTQATRVVPKYEAFIKKFPTVRALARSPLSDVLVAWQGLGYNRRAKALWDTARAIVTFHKGKFPKSQAALLALPGIGPYTAGAVRIFAWNLPDVIIETNIRSAYIHHFFSRGSNIPDSKILSLLRVPQGKARVWYSALMDYGAHIKKTVPNPSRRSVHHAKQKPFRGSDREIRGALLTSLLARPATERELKRLGFPAERVTAQLHALVRDGLLRKRGGRYRA